MRVVDLIDKPSERVKGKMEQNIRIPCQKSKFVISLRLRKTNCQCR